jgi:hypothetical protein
MLVTEDGTGLANAEVSSFLDVSHRGRSMMRGFKAWLARRLFGDVLHVPAEVTLHLTSAIELPEGVELRGAHR